MKTTPLLALACVLALAGPVHADDDEARRDHDHDRARRALQAGDVLPLADLLARTGVEDDGRLLEVELENEHGRLIYELKILTPEGRVIEQVFDAGTGALLETKGKHR
ncbi:PepSY domain-containing protein [Caenispirillum bisanense]|uniref:Uncharacterized membrane protein YkoI n=1 Tax=Caenispirillum bisanense TaxID=414052 RepID=A0A286GA79_9PROT|nr:hypothetical protein [Caenispirillum bisanense]SOD92418.1 Uncharacterized membrane protein YkoI [Caenispirillum bisanense]